MNDFLIENNFAYFPRLKNLGVRNFCTWGNDFWENMRFTGKVDNQEKYKKILGFLEPNISKPIITIRAQQLDQVQFINKNNLHIIQRLLKNDEKYNQNDIYLYEVECDGVLTKESIPVFKTVGDCSVIIITGVDKRDNKRFAALLHSGLNGALLNISKNAIDLAHQRYDFNNEDLDIFIYPYICKEHFSWRKEDFDKELEILGINDNFHELRGGRYFIDYGKKIVIELIKLGIRENKINQTNLCTYEEHEKGYLMSNRYQNQFGDKSNGRYLVGMCL